MKKNLFLGVAVLGLALGMTSCGDEVSPSVSDSTSNPSVSTTASPSTDLSASDSASNNSTSTDLPPVQDVFIVTVYQKSSFSTFAENKMEKTNKQTEFADLTRGYIVGDDNAINVKPDVVFENALGVLTDVDSWNYKIDIFIKSEDNQYVSLGESDLNTYIDAIDTVNCDIDFAEAAVEKEFRVIVTPEGLTDRQLESVTRYQASMDFEIVDGYNVYNAKELSYYNNCYIAESDDWKDDAEAWEMFKIENGLDPEYDPSALILHDNISVKTTDVPDMFFYKAGDEDLVEGAEDYDRTLGSLRDNVDIYAHFYDMDDQFTIYGNYYTLNFAEFPYVTRESGKVTKVGAVISHANLFRSEALKEARNNNATCKFTMRDLNLIGNAPKQENTILGGGLIMNKNHNMKALMENNISRMWFITYMPERDYSNYLINDCKAYDNFNSFIYNWGGTVASTNCEFIGAGGPIIIQDHVDNDANGEGGSVGRSTFTNCKLESFVAGTEGWFDLVGAKALAPTIKALNAAFTNFGANYVFDRNDTTMLNLISVNKSGSNQGLTLGEKIKGSVKIDDNPAFDFGETNPYLAGFISNVTKVSSAAPIYQSTGADNAFAYYDGECLNDGQNKLNTPAAATNPIFQGDYLGLYYQGMCFTFGYYHPAPLN